MLKIKEGVSLKELEKFGFFNDGFFQIVHKPIYEDYLEQYKKQEYLIICPKSKVIVKGKLCCILDLQGNKVNGFDLKTNKVKKYIQDIIQAELVEEI